MSDGITDSQDWTIPPGKKRWVQYKNDPNGEKWEVVDELPVQWVVSQGAGIPRAVLPKLDYLICDPPEEWEDVTGECDWCGGLAFFGDEIVTEQRGYRFRKVQVNFPAEGQAPTGTPAHCGWAFIIERRKA